jgi:hypothetical protein
MSVVRIASIGTPAPTGRRMRARIGITTTFASSSTTTSETARATGRQPVEQLVVQMVRDRRVGAGELVHCRVEVRLAPERESGQVQGRRASPPSAAPTS